MEISQKQGEIKNLNFAEVNENKFNELREELISLQSEGKYYKHMLSSLETPDLSDDICTHCGQSIDDEHRKNIEESNEIKSKSYKKKMKEIKNKLDSRKLTFNELKIQKSINEKYLNVEKDLELVFFKHKNVTDRLLELKDDHQTLSDKILSLEEKRRVNVSVLESLKDDTFSSLKDKLKKSKLDISERETSIKNNDEKIIKAKVALSVVKEKTEMYKRNLSSIKETKNELQRYEKLSKFLGKSGIQTILLNNLIEELESKTNEILVTICNEPIQINLETQRMGSDGTTVVETLDLKIRKDGNYHDFKSLSGGEKFRISLSLRLAMSELSSIFGGTKMGFLLLDEVNSPLDRYGVETLFVSVIKSLEERYKIMVITHDESLKEKFDNILEVSKVNGESTTKFYTI